MYKCPDCGTKVAYSSPMCYACGEKLDNVFNLDRLQSSLFKEANKAMDDENWNKAIENYSQLIVSRPDVSHFLICLGIAYASLGDNDNAWIYYNRAININSNDYEPWLMRLEFSLKVNGSYLKTHIDEYMHNFNGSTDSLIKLAGSIISQSKKHNNIVIDICKKVLNQDIENKKAIKLMRQAERGPGLFSRLVG